MYQKGDYYIPDDTVSSQKKFQLRMCSAVIIDGGLCSIECRQKQGFPRNNLKLSLYGINNKRSSDTVEKWLY